MNKYQEALDNIGDISIYYEDGEGYCILSESFAKGDYFLLKELVDKETPKKAIPFFDSFKCPRCKEELNFDYRIIRYPIVRGPLNVRICPAFDYCQNCGQAIDWGTENG